MWTSENTLFLGGWMNKGHSRHRRVAAPNTYSGRFSDSLLCYVRSRSTGQLKALAPTTIAAAANSGGGPPLGTREPLKVVLPAVALIPNARQTASCCACTMASSACLEVSVALAIMASAARPSGAAAPNAG